MLSQFLLGFVLLCFPVSLHGFWSEKVVVRKMPNVDMLKQESEALINGYFEYHHRRLPSPARFGKGNHVSIGTLSFEIDPQAGSLQAQLYLVSTEGGTAGSNGEQPSNVIFAALNDPHRGGLYEKGDGFFVYDRQHRVIQLAKNFDPEK